MRAGRAPASTETGERPGEGAPVTAEPGRS
jgi:hypothetical protein